MGEGEEDPVWGHARTRRVGLLEGPKTLWREGDELSHQLP